MERQFSERQLIRWAIPGWITLFLVLILILIHICFNGVLRGVVHDFIKDDSLGEIVAIGAATITAGFALGFILFQIYFVSYWCDRKLFCIFPKISTLVGGVVDYEDVFNSLTNYKDYLTKEFGHWPVEPKGNRTPRQQYESSVSAAWWRSMDRKKDEQRKIWEERNQYLVAIYHSMGTILVGTYLVSIVYLIWNIWYICQNGWDLNSELWPLLINMILLGVWICVLLKGRKDTEFSHRNLTKNALYHFYKQDEI